VGRGDGNTFLGAASNDAPTAARRERQRNIWSVDQWRCSPRAAPALMQHRHLWPLEMRGQIIATRLASGGVPHIKHPWRVPTSTCSSALSNPRTPCFCIRRPTRVSTAGDFAGDPADGQPHVD